MSKINIRWGWFLGIAICGSSIGSTNCAFADIIPDGTLPKNSSVKLEGNNSIIEGGTQAGGNLFHSFREFSVPPNGAALFNNAANIQNIISRVTGGSVSKIDGLIYANGTANLFLINPSGIIFGRNAALDIGGSFLGTTATSMRFQDGTRLLTTTDRIPLLTVSVPIGLGFTGVPRDIQMQSSYLSVGVTDYFRDFALVGGNISLNNTSLITPGNQVELAGLAGSGTVGLSVNGNILSLNVPENLARADVSLQNSTSIKVIAGDGGSIDINAHNLDIMGESQLLAGIESGRGTVNSQAGDITLDATGEIKVIGSSVLNAVLSQGNGGNLTINTQQLLVGDAAQVGTPTFSTGNSGNLTVTADSIQLIGTFADSRSSSGLFTINQPGSTGDAGDLTINTQQLLVQDGARIGASTYGAGKGGNLTVTAESVQLIGTSAGEQRDLVR